MVELMIAVLLASILAGSIITVFVNNTHSCKQDENSLRRQDDARYAHKISSADPARGNSRESTSEGPARPAPDHRYSCEPSLH